MSKKALVTIMAAVFIVASGQCPAASATKNPALSSKKVTVVKDSALAVPDVAIQ